MLFIYSCLYWWLCVGQFRKFSLSDKYNLHVAAINSEHFQDIFDPFDFHKLQPQSKYSAEAFEFTVSWLPCMSHHQLPAFLFKLTLAWSALLLCWPSSRSWCLTGSWQIQLWSRFDCSRSAGASPESNEALFSHKTGSYSNSYFLFIGHSGNNALRGFRNGL